MTLTPAFVKVKQTDAVLRLTMSRPERRNALSVGMMEALHSELTAAQADTSVNVIVLSGEGPAFSAGHDLKELTGARATADEGKAFFEETFALCTRLMLAIANSDKPVIAEVSGLATAAGCQLAATCDLVVAAHTARFATPGVNIGLFCSTPSVPLLRAVPAKIAMDMLLTGDAIDAATAYRAGLVSRLVDPEELTNITSALAAQIAAKPADIISLGKRAVRAQAQLPLEQAYTAAQTAMQCNLTMNAAIDGIAAFLAPKAPKF